MDKIISIILPILFFYHDVTRNSDDWYLYNLFTSYINNLKNLREKKNIVQFCGIFLPSDIDIESFCITANIFPGVIHSKDLPVGHEGIH